MATVGDDANDRILASKAAHREFQYNFPSHREHSPYHRDCQSEDPNLPHYRLPLERYILELNRVNQHGSQKPIYPWMGVPAGVWCWHIHHGELLEISDEPLDLRARYIVNNKPRHEIHIRLRMMRPLFNPWTIPTELDEAGKRYVKAKLLLNSTDSVTFKDDVTSEQYIAAMMELKFEGQSVRAELVNALEVHYREVLNSPEIRKWKTAAHRSECGECPYNEATGEIQFGQNGIHRFIASPVEEEVNSTFTAWKESIKEYVQNP